MRERGRYFGAGYEGAIAESFNSLVRQRGIDKVTVKAVIEDCGISRQTFYYHFQDIMDVVEWCARQAVAHMVERSLAAASPQEALAELIRSTAENYTLLRKLMNSQRHEQIQHILGEAARSYLEELARRRPTAFRAEYGDAGHRARLSHLRPSRHTAKALRRARSRPLTSLRNR